VHHVLTIEEHQDAGVVTLVCGGELDYYSAAHLRMVVHQKLTAGSPAIILDLTKLTYLDSVGIATLNGLTSRATDSHRILRLAALPEAIQRFIRALRLENQLSIYPTVPLAMASLDPSASS
jgi:anti-sigma B factor antagonist